ncbi:MAG: class I SAM-dependent methyltransferase [Ruminococcaceae bacterium]|nr:class I SAM-dependent methyltransferase [Oscillospiraceae bacterium]
MLEKMSEFFDNRIDGYDEHMMTCIESAEEFYPYTAECLPVGNNVNVLDLGCGTGLELEYYFKINPTASVTGIDLTESMLNVLKKKFTDKNLNLILGSYFDLPFGIEIYDAAVSVESLHHFTKEEKIPLYAKLHKALKNGGYFVLTDYFASSDEDEQMYRKELLRLKKLQGIKDNEFYHYDTPLTVEHEKEAFIKSGFSSVDVLDSWDNTYTIRANK